MSKKDTCKIYYNSEYVSWTIPRHCIENTLLGTSSKPGLLYLNVESAGEIDFEDTTKDFTGVVSWVASEAEFTPKIIQTKEERVNLVYAVKVLVENDGSLKIGMPGEIWFN